MIVGVALAGGIGAALRYGVDSGVTRRVRARVPLGTWVVNVSGSFLLGVLVGLGAEVVPDALRTVLGVGLLGGYTTFSTASVEAVSIARDRGDGVLRAVAHASTMLVVSLAAAGLGLALA